MANTNALKVVRPSLNNIESLEINHTGFFAFADWFLQVRGIIFLSFTLQSKDQEAWRRFSANDITPDLRL